MLRSKSAAVKARSKMRGGGFRVRKMKPQLVAPLKDASMNEMASLADPTIVSEAFKVSDIKQATSS